MQPPNDNQENASSFAPQTSSPLTPKQSIPLVSQPEENASVNTQSGPDVDQNRPQVNTLPVADGIHVFTSAATSANQNAIEASAGKVKLGKFLKVLLILTFLLSIFVAIPAGVWAVAYEKIELKFAPEVQQKVGYVVMSLPYTPKTAKFILVKSALVSQEVTSNSFDVSAAINTSQAQDLLGTNNLDFAMKGAVNYFDPQNINTHFNLSLTKDINLDFRKKGNDIYFKLNKFPLMILSLFGISSDAVSPLLNKWVHYDISPLNTPARQMLNESPRQFQSQEEILKELEKVFDKKLLSAINVASEIDEDVQVYKLTLGLTDELLNHFFQNLEREVNKGKTDLYLQDQYTSKPSDNIKNTKIVILVEKETYLLKKLSAHFDLVADNRLSQIQTDSKVLGLTTPNLFSPGDKAKVAMVANFSDYGKLVVIDVPQDLMSTEEFGNKISEIFLSSYGPMFGQSQNAMFDAERIVGLQQLSYGLEFYNTDCGYYPVDLEDLIGPGCNIQSGTLITVPKDPDGSSYYYQVSTDKKSYDLCANLDNPRNTTCPNSTYNYHLTSPNNR